MRGKGPSTTRCSAAWRITPAHAGKRRQSSSSRRASGDHPRTCGEKSPAPDILPMDIGSPPHMRGKAVQLWWLSRRLRITPAHAGKRLGTRHQENALRDHPRTCGEKLHLRRPAGCNAGSPPHMRGKGRGGRRVYGRSGITPAHAGKSRQGQQQGPDEQDHPRTCGEKDRAAVLHTAGRGSPPHMRGKV